MDFSVDSNVLSASSLLLAIVAALYSLWYPEICRARDIEVKEHRLDREPEIKIVKAAFWTRAVPLSAAVIVLLVIFLPATLSIIINSARAFAESPARSIKQYNMVEAAFVTVWLFEIFLAVVNVNLARRVKKTLADLDRADTEPVPAG